MLTLLSGIAVIILAELLYISAWLSVSRLSWLYYVWAILAVFLWAQPWRRSDPYRTDQLKLRLAVYGILGLASISASYVFQNWQPLLVSLQALILGLLEYMGQKDARA